MPTPAADRALREGLDALGAAAPRGLLDAVEAHGLSPLLRRRLRALELSVPDALAQSLTALAVRHREASRVHTSTLVELVGALDARGIETVFLKGAVLAHELYPAPELRPRRDIDVLVAPHDAVAALRVLSELGFEGFDPSTVPRGHHHHLPGVSARREGFAVAVEVHTDALSHDQLERMPLAAVRHAVRSVPVGGRTVLALGHDDMLRHVAAHLLQPGREPRLINVVDRVEWAAAHEATIDWVRLGRESPRTVITLSLMHYLTALPDTLARLRPSAPAPDGVGENVPMLSSLEWRLGALPATLGQLLYPSAWWMHGFYGVPPERSLAGVRWSRHAPRAARWVLRRVLHRGD
ncbi:MAG: nucleotidyltransferase family protein [Vicinamibacterales bacterium]